MGIRFYCPNGHKLHVKAFLAGKRGICPECGVKVMIPTESDPAFVKDPKRAAAESGPAEIVTTGAPKNVDLDAARSISVESPPSEPAEPQPLSESAPAPSVPTPSPDAPAAEAIAATQPVVDVDKTSAVASGASDPIAEAPHAVWYVRPPAGGQYGPASGDVMRTWITEGRVTADSLVWREGWPEWRSAGELFPGLISPVAAPDTESATADMPDIVTTPVQGSSLELYRRRKSTKTALTVAVLLLIACIILFGALVYVIRFMN